MHNTYGYKWRKCKAKIIDTAKPFYLSKSPQNARNHTLIHSTNHILFSCFLISKSQLWGLSFLSFYFLVFISGVSRAPVNFDTFSLIKKELF